MKWLKFFSIILFLGVLSGGGYFALNHYFSSSIHEKVERDPFVPEGNAGKVLTSTSNSDVDVSKEPFAMLLLGVDSEEISSGRSDTILVGIVNPKKQKISLLSIPRDTRVPIAGKDKVDKINSAYNYGVATTIKTVENFLQIPISYYSTVNFNGFQDVVDELGGITVDVEKDLTFHDRIKMRYFTLQEGTQHLTGYQALNYARFRGDAEGDFGRNRRQQQVISAILDQSLDFRNVTKITSLLDILGDNAKTDLSLKDITKLAVKFRNLDGSDVETVKLTAYPENIDGISYVMVDDDEKEKTQNDLQTLLNGEELDEN
jgi:LCP family protein required for cell wall assembly